MPLEAAATGNMRKDKVRIRLRAFDHRVLDQSAEKIVDTVRRTGARISGPVLLPTEKQIYTVQRSPFVDKESMEHFEMRTHKRLIDIFEANGRTIEALNRLVVPAGVFVKIKT
jgi:small subunit ribosomal protein S10